MELLDNALEEFRNNLKETPEGQTYIKDSGERHRYYIGALDPNESVARLRLDFEIEEGLVLSGDDDTVWKLLFEQARYDLADVIENGDTGTTDPLLRAFNGSKKRGQEPVAVDFLSGTLIKVRKRRKATFEFTLWLTLYVKWESPQEYRPKPRKTRKKK